MMDKQFPESDIHIQKQIDMLTWFRIDGIKIDWEPQL